MARKSAEQIEKERLEKEEFDRKIALIDVLDERVKKLEERLAATEVVDDSEIKISYELSQLASTNKSVRVNQELYNEFVEIAKSKNINITTLLNFMLDDFIKKHK